METKAERIYVYGWGKYIPHWKGRRCRVIARGRAMNSALVEFIDNSERAVVSRNALRRVHTKGSQSWRAAKPRIRHGTH